MAKKTYLHRGLITKLDSKFAKIAGLFDLERWWKEVAVKHSVPFNDVCNEECPTPVGLPLRAILTGEGGVSIQVYDGTEWLEIGDSVGLSLTIIP